MIDTASLAFWIDITGWIGGILVLVAFTLISTGRVDKDNPFYHWINIFGALCLIVNTGYLKAYPSMVVNVVWVGVALFALLRNNKCSLRKI
jgi:hypothetical protein